jgi:transcriptional regulator with XRE-family HTH domain
MTFSEKLVRLRKNNYMTQEEFSKKVGVSRQAVYKWESGQSYPEAMALVKIKELFGISIDNLLDESFEVEAPERKRARKAREVVSEKETAPENYESTVTEEQKTAAPEQKTEEKAQEVFTPSKKEDEKRVGFFGRLFGRR